MSLTAGIILLAILAVLSVANRTSPTRIWLAAWSLLWIIHAILGYDYYSSMNPMIVVFCGNVAFALGGILSGAVGVRVQPEQNAQLRADFVASVTSRMSINATYLAIVLMVVGVEVGLRQLNGASILNFVTSTRILDAVRENQVALLAEYDAPTGYKIATVFLCFASAMVGLIYSAHFDAPNSRPRHRLSWSKAFLATFLLGATLIFSAASSIRSYLVIGLLFFAFAFLTGSVLQGFERKVISAKNAVLVLIGSALFVGWVVVIQSARLGDVNFENLGRTMDHLRPWASGYLPAFSLWFDNYFEGQLLWGASLLRGVLAPLGLVGGEGFDERQGAMNLGLGQSSNAMTMFRVMVSDFGDYGAIIFCGFWGWFSELAYRRTLTRGSFWIGITIANYCAIFFSINAWFFGYGARIAGAALLCFALTFFWVRAKSATKRKNRVVDELGVEALLKTGGNLGSGQSRPASAAGRDR